MTFFADSQNSIAGAFPNEAFRLVDFGGDAKKEDPFNAWMVFRNSALTLRLVRDHGLDHIDVQVQEADGSLRWVSLEILAVAAGLKTAEQYADAYTATLRACEAEDGEMPQEATMIEAPLGLVAQAKEHLIEAAKKPVAILGAEIKIGECTRKAMQRALSTPSPPRSHGPSL